MLVMSSCSEPSSQDSRVERLPFYQDATFRPHWISEDSDSLASFHQIFPFRLYNQSGDLITEKTFEDKIYVTDFFFTICPGICPKMTENMALLQAEYLADDEVLLLSHSVSPEHDTVAVLKEYADLKGIDQQTWHLATGERSHIYELGRKAYFVEENMGLTKGPDDFLHTENFVLVDKNRHIRGIYNGLNKTAIKQLIADIQTLKEEG